ncbi:MAG: hypothetical protein ACTS6G_05480 [Candidatus Hodgkinia cicadicola]
MVSAFESYFASLIPQTRRRKPFHPPTFGLNPLLRMRRSGFETANSIHPAHSVRFE